MPADSPYAHLTAPSEEGDDKVPPVASVLQPVKGEDETPTIEIAPEEPAPATATEAPAEAPTATE